MKLFLTQSYSGSDWTNEWFERQSDAVNSAKQLAELLSVETKVFACEVNPSKSGIVAAMNAAYLNHMNLTEVEAFTSVSKIR